MYIFLEKVYLVSFGNKYVYFDMDEIFEEMKEFFVWK